MALYEHVFLARQDLSQQQVDALVEQYKGVVTAKRTENGRNLIDLEIWTEDPTGQKTTPGTATVALP